jgi:hypothetical protein
MWKHQKWSHENADKIKKQEKSGNIKFNIKTGEHVKKCTLPHLQSSCWKPSGS